MTVYLKFDGAEQAYSELEQAGFELSEWKDAVTKPNAIDWGTVFTIPNVTGHHANLFDCECPESLKQFQVPEPSTPYNKVL